MRLKSHWFNSKYINKIHIKYRTLNVAYKWVSFLSCTLWTFWFNDAELKFFQCYDRPVYGVVTPLTYFNSAQKVLLSAFPFLRCLNTLLYKYANATAATGQGGVELISAWGDIWGKKYVQNPYRNRTEACPKLSETDTCSTWKYLRPLMPLSMSLCRHIMVLESPFSNLIKCYYITEQR